jgi:poly-gamma-glutamate synthesis protein (capsule biosynthesis protein)
LTAEQEATAKFAAEHGALIVVGHHPHVVQGLAVIGHTTVAYSLGNCVFGGNTAPRDYDAALLRVTLRFAAGAPRETQVALWPIRISGAARGNDYRPVLLSGADAQRVVYKAQATSGFALTPFTDGLGAVQQPVPIP